MLTLRYGGVVFVLVYLSVFLLLGVPMLLLEMTLGQYSGLTPTKFYRNLCPVISGRLWRKTMKKMTTMTSNLTQALTGVGFALCLILLAHAMSDLASVSWCARAMFLLFSGRPREALPQDFFYKDVLGFVPDAEGVSAKIPLRECSSHNCIFVGLLHYFIFRLESWAPCTVS